MFTLTVNPSQMLTLSGLGITNNSGITQNFVVGNNPAQIKFTNSAATGAQTTFTTTGGNSNFTIGGIIYFFDTSSANGASFINNGGTTSGSYGGEVSFAFSSSAGNATFINNGKGIDTASRGGKVIFSDSASASTATITNLPNGTPIDIFGGGATEFAGVATAASAVITNEGATVSGQIGGATHFGDTSHAGTATIICNGGQVAGAGGGIVHFTEGGNPANATLIANAGVNGGDGGQIQLFGRSAVGTPRVMIFGNATLDLTGQSPGSVGSLEGDGIAKIGNGLTVGSNNLSTIFSGTIQSGNALIKVGTGSLTLTGTNAYGQTEVDDGTLIVDGTTGSTGITSAQVNAGTLGGSGIIPGSLTIGGATQAPAFLAPAVGTRIQKTLTVQSLLEFFSDGTYSCTFKAKGRRASTDLVIGNGVFIDGGAKINLRGKVQGTLQAGLVLTLISNTSANPISGTFSNLPDGVILTIGGNNFQASYEGGDGNDLTLTVVP